MGSTLIYSNHHSEKDVRMSFVQLKLAYKDYNVDIIRMFTQKYIHRRLAAKLLLSEDACTNILLASFSQTS